MLEINLKLILCPIDFSEFSPRVYRHALSVAEHYQAKLVALHVVELFRFTSLGFAASAGLYDEAWYMLICQFHRCSALVSSQFVLDLFPAVPTAPLQ